MSLPQLKWLVHTAHILVVVDSVFTHSSSATYDYMYGTSLDISWLAQSMCLFRDQKPWKWREFLLHLVKLLWWNLT